MGVIRDLRRFEDSFHKYKKKYNIDVELYNLDYYEKDDRENFALYEWRRCLNLDNPSDILNYSKITDWELDFQFEISRFKSEVKTKMINFEEGHIRIEPNGNIYYCNICKFELL